MRFRSVANPASILVLALLPFGSGFAGLVLAKAPCSVGQPDLPQVARELHAAPAHVLRNAAGTGVQSRRFPDAATLQSSSAAGQGDSPRLLTQGEMAALQFRMDRLNDLWETTTRCLHRRMAIVTQEMIDRGELQPSGAASHEDDPAVIGGQWTMHQGVAYEKAFHLGEDAEIDALAHRRELLTQFADRIIQAAFH